MKKAAGAPVAAAAAAVATASASAAVDDPDQLKVHADKVLEVLGKTPKVTDMVAMIQRKTFKTEYAFAWMT